MPVLSVCHIVSPQYNGENMIYKNTNLLVHLMSDKLEVGYFCSVLNQSPHILSIGFINVIIHCFQIQAVHLQRVGNLQTDAEVNCLAEERQGEAFTDPKYRLESPLLWSAF